MPKTTKGLTATAGSKMKTPGRYADGSGLYLQVLDSLSKRWEWRGMVDGKRKLVGIGTADLYSLAEAREIAREWSRLAKEGMDPKAHRDALRFDQRAVRAVPTFEAVARECHEKTIQPAMRNAKHIQQWINTLADYVFPVIGSMRINEITTQDVRKALEPIWLEKPETARRVKQRIGKVFEYARTVPECRFDRVNPVDGLKQALPSQKNAQAKEHHPALPYADLPALMTDLQAVDSISSLALQFIILTACRSGEVRGAQWSEIDLKARTWTVPRARMKAGKDHRVSLSDAAMAILERTRGLSDEWVFPSPQARKALSDVAVAKVLKRFHEPTTATVHGMRSTFRDWCEEQTSFPHAVKERALAHTVRNQAEAAYNRTDLFEKRRNLMDTWGRVTQSALHEAGSGTVIDLKSRKA
ncbi:MAG: integrase arm-type DNA-binding domain-containing protein [Pseudomonadota bacterium]